MVRDDLSQQHVALSVAAATTYHRMRSGAIATDVEILSTVLNDAAHALANVIPVYVIDEGQQVPRALTSMELMKGKFGRGATRFSLPNRSAFSALSVTRADMRDALLILRKAGVRFR